jgi:hypothetical protein
MNQELKSGRTWGGKREGAGRKARSPDGRRVVMMNVCVLPGTMEMLEERIGKLKATSDRPEMVSRSMVVEELLVRAMEGER